MKSYSDLIDRVFREPHLLEKLTPTEPLDWELLCKVRDADDAAIAGNRTIAVPAAFALVRGGLLYAVDALDAAHRYFQEAPSDLGSYWHGMMHRREGDFDNARYWFRRAGTLGCSGTLHRAASEVSADAARQPGWDPYFLTGQCEQARFGANELVPELVKLQQIEFETLFDYSWRQSGLA
jgi:hypothetical protein